MPQNLPQPSADLPAQDSELIEHSADLMLFARYLQRLPARVKVTVKDTEHGADVYAIYQDGAGEFRYQFARLIPDEKGVSTQGGDIYAEIHKAFRAALPASGYLGFRGCGRFAIAPLMHVAKLYERYGRGVFLDGDSKPRPCAAIESQYGWQIRNFRTDAPLR